MQNDLYKSACLLTYIAIHGILWIITSHIYSNPQTDYDTDIACNSKTLSGWVVWAIDVFCIVPTDYLLLIVLYVWYSHRAQLGIHMHRHYCSEINDLGLYIAVDPE